MNRVVKKQPVQAENASAGGTVHLAVRILRYCGGGQGGAIFLGLVLMALGAGAAILQPWPLKLIIDSVVGNHEAPGFLTAVAGMLSIARPEVALLAVLTFGILAVHLLKGALNVLSTYVVVGVGLRMVFKLRCAVFNHIQRLSLKFHDSNTVGDSLYRVTWDTYCIQTIFNSGVLPAVTAVITLSGIAVIMFLMDWVLTLVALSVGVPLIMLIRRLDKPMTEHSMRVHERESDISTRVQETLTGIRAVQAFGREQIESERFRDNASASLKARLRLTVLQTVSGAIISLVLAAGTAAVIWIAAMRVLQGRLTEGDIVLLAAYAGMLYGPLNTLAYTATTVQGAAAGVRRIFKLLDTAPEVSDGPNAKPLVERPAGHINLEQVCFEYQPGEPVLRDVDLEIPAGSTVALVGPSGAGKTTLVSLLMRFYDPTSGRITLDGTDLREITLDSLRKNVALVLQEPILFAATIRENIAYGRPDATAEQIIAAAQAAGAHEFIQALPEGYDTRIGERGARLSGGQRQRISIARAFLRDAPVLIMDEPTSALDAETESALLEAMGRLTEGRTTIIIAHRLSTIRNASQVVVLKNGVVVQTGTHDELLMSEGMYRHLHELQFGESPRSALAGSR